MCAARAAFRGAGQQPGADAPHMKGAAMLSNGVAAHAGAGGDLQQQQQQQRPPAPPEPGATWCRRAARAVRQRLQDAQQLFREYQYVVALDDTIRHAQGDAVRADCAQRNRYANVLPYDYNRVHLPRSCGSSYINASRIQLQPPHTDAPALYIATQGPLPHTAEHFWRMALDARAPAVVMLTNCVEKGTVKCAQYFPSAPGEAAAFGALRLQVLSRERFSADCERRTLRLTDGGGGGGELTLQHFHYHTWPDHGVPDNSETLRRVCRELQRLRSAGAAPGGGAAGPPVLHCSAGIGRTGTFIAVDVILRRVDSWFRPGGPSKNEVEAALDVPLLVHSLRQQRGGMVQTLEQYCFVYRAALDELEERQAGGGGGGGGGGAAMQT
ncbi:MAG: protein-tyrosine phosphatase-like protein [Monoraphidium minutum]|nr:MAG: protein-tyrosine phosphatase-like protein [Monoraphidium minutum]